MPMPITPPAIEDASVLSRYPFLPQAVGRFRQLLNENGIDIEALVEEPWLDEVRRRGSLRVKESIVHDEGVDSATVVDMSSELGQMTETLSFLYAMLLVCASADERLLARWCEGEAARADRLFGQDGARFEIIVRTYLSDIRPIGEVRGETVWAVPVADFIELCPRISGAYWRLPNRPVDRGWVHMDPSGDESSQQRVARLLKERVRFELSERGKKRMEEMDERFASLFAEEAGRVVGVLQAHAAQRIELSGAEPEDWPPCMAIAASELASGVNVNHVGRVFLAAMASTIGLPREQCCSFFAGAPDYDPETTRYQVDHVYDGEYTPHGCQTLKINARCPVSPGDDSLCDQEWMTHPLKYLRVKQKRNRAARSDGGSTSGAESEAGALPPANP